MQIAKAHPNPMPVDAADDEELLLTQISEQSERV
jgi:hypothetical protein